MNAATPELLAALQLCASELQRLLDAPARDLVEQHVDLNTINAANAARRALANATQPNPCPIDHPAPGLVARALARRQEAAEALKLA